jgi:hypothetical protein
VTFAADPGFDTAVAPFGEAAARRRPQSRAVVTVNVTRICDACGYAVPKMELVAEREILDAWAETRGPERIAAYHAARNATSVDGLPGLPVAAPAGP